MFIKSLFALFLITISGQAFVAQSAAAPCAGERMKEFAFWAGEWDLEWRAAGGEVQKGSNTVKWILDGCVLREEFDGGKDLPLKGQSYSMLDQASGKWKQTWVDNQGSYLDFTGGLEDGKMVLSRSFERKTQDGATRMVMQRMVFYNITRDSLDWNWENSTDGGKTWNLAWQIKYVRRSK